MWIYFFDKAGDLKVIGVPEGAVAMHVANLRHQGLTIRNLTVTPPAHLARG